MFPSLSPARQLCPAQSRPLRRRRTAGRARAQQGSDSGSTAARLEGESAQQVAAIQQQMGSGKEAVLAKLVRAVTTV